MGCCLSTKREPAPCHPKDQNALTDLHQSRDNRAPPPPPTEEETVKEVLSVSETPKPIVLSPKPKPPLSHIGSVDLKDPDLVDDAVSEPARSELSSSTVTNEFSYEESEVRSSTRRVRSSNSRVRSRPEWNAGAGRDRVVGRSPTRRSDLSPARRGGGGGSVRLVPGREQRHPDTGSAAGMRSRSPAGTRSTATGRNPSSIRRVSQSPGRVRTNSGEGLKKGEENGGGGSKWPSSNPNSANEETEVNPNESLENSLVSLECFIFL